MKKRYHKFMSHILIHIGQFFISWSNWHYKKLPRETVHVMSGEEINTFFMMIQEKRDEPKVFH